MFVHSRWCISLFLVERLGFELKLVECVWRRKEEGTQTKIQHNPGSPARPTPSPTAHPFHSQPKPAPFNFLPHRPSNQRPAQLARARPSATARSLCSLPPSPAFRSRSPRERPLWLTSRACLAVSLSARSRPLPPMPRASCQLLLPRRDTHASAPHRDPLPHGPP